MKKMLCSALVVASLTVSSFTAFGESPEETVTQNEGLQRAYVHESERIIANNGSYGYTKAYTYDGSKIYYLKAIIKATYSNGLVDGGSTSNPNTSNQSSVSSGYVYENGPKRQYHSSSEAKNTSSSAMEYKSGKSDIFN